MTTVSTIIANDAHPILINLKDLIVGDVIYEVDIDNKLYGPDVVLKIDDGNITVVTYSNAENVSVIYDLDVDTEYTRAGHISIDNYLYDLCKKAAELKI
jgi:hypothetical protein